MSAKKKIFYGIGAFLGAMTAFLFVFGPNPILQRTNQKELPEPAAN